MNWPPAMNCACGALRRVYALSAITYYDRERALPAKKARLE